ncbi:DUF6612 family protein [Paenibacillus sp. P22]|uniref:DUF6612 family protein n=1 Tax=Paenibacillus sp. P22 TaxID=483908 RepID=UPI00038F9C8C|nr:DUF6612 family protein [Paenibacillus sp. P22]CDN44627.1 Putative uncharacterized protein [Paenibacillus sp. P22]
MNRISKPIRSRLERRQRHWTAGLMLGSLLIAAGCAGPQDQGGQVPSAAQTTGTPSPSPAGQDEAGLSPASMLERGSKALAEVRNFDLDMELRQQMVTDGETTSMSMSNKGTIFLEPLVLKQVTVNDFMGEQSTIDSYLNKDGYYMYDHSNSSWSRMLASEVPKIKATLSDFQIAPSKELDKIKPHAASFKASSKEGVTTLAYSGDGKDEAAQALVRDLLRSTMGTDEMDAAIRDSIQVASLEYSLEFDEKTGLLKRLKADADVTIEYDEGNPSKLHQELALNYGSWNGAKAVQVPKEALTAPEVMPADQGLLDALGVEEGEQP